AERVGDANGLLRILADRGDGQRAGDTVGQGDDATGKLPSGLGRAHLLRDQVGNVAGRHVYRDLLDGRDGLVGGRVVGAPQVEHQRVGRLVVGALLGGSAVEQRRRRTERAADD